MLSSFGSAGGNRIEPPYEGVPYNNNSRRHTAAAACPTASTRNTEQSKAFSAKMLPSAVPAAPISIARTVRFVRVHRILGSNRHTFLSTPWKWPGQTFNTILTVSPNQSINPSPAPGLKFLFHKSVSKSWYTFSKGTPSCVENFLMLRFDALKRVKILVIAAGGYFSYFPIFSGRKNSDIKWLQCKRTWSFQSTQSINQDDAGFTEAGLNCVKSTREYSTSYSKFRFFMSVFLWIWKSLKMYWWKYGYIKGTKQSAGVETVHELKQWQAAWAKGVSDRKPQAKFAPSASPWERPCLNSGTVSTQGLCFVRDKVQKFATRWKMVNKCARTRLFLPNPHWIWILIDTLWFLAVFDCIQT